MDLELDFLSAMEPELVKVESLPESSTRTFYVGVKNPSGYQCPMNWNMMRYGIYGISVQSKLPYPSFAHIPTIRSSSICRDIFGPIEEGIIFSTFSSLTAFSHIHRKFEPCLEELLEWCGDDFNGVIIFDEFNQSKMQFTTTVRKHLQYFVRRLWNYSEDYRLQESSTFVQLEFWNPRICRTWPALDCLARAFDGNRSFALFLYKCWLLIIKLILLSSQNLRIACGLHGVGGQGNETTRNVLGTSTLFPGRPL